MLLFVCLFLHKLASNKPGMNLAPTKNSILNIAYRGIGISIGREMRYNWV